MLYCMLRAKYAEFENTRVYNTPRLSFPQCLTLLQRPQLVSFIILDHGDLKRRTSSRSKNFYIFVSRRLSHYQPTSQNQLGIFSPPYQVLPKFCPRSSSLESKELILSNGDTAMYTFLTSTQVILFSPSPSSYSFQSIQIPSRDRRPRLPSAVCHTVSGTPISIYPLRPSTLIDAPINLNS